MDRLFLIDGSALAYRSHFAFGSNPLTNSKGMQTGAVFGFITTLLRLMEREKPNLIAVVFDTPTPTFRHKAYAAYKATREKMPDEMAEQLPYIQKTVEALGIPYLARPTYEADDVMATLAHQAEQKNIHTFLVSGDKDLLQLLGPNISLYQLKKGLDPEVINVEGPLKKWGVPVKYVTDFLALMGDHSDNVPGVPGVGEKTASKLISQFGSLEDLYRQLDKVTPATLQIKLRTHKDQAFLCKELVTLDRNVPLSVTADALTPKPPHTTELRALFEELEFQSLLSTLPTQTQSKKTGTVERYVQIQTQNELDALVKKLLKAKEFAVDTEATSLHPADTDLVGISFAMSPGEAYFVAMKGTSLRREEIISTLKPILENALKAKGGQNIKFDQIVFHNAGIHLSGVTFDTMIESYLLDPEGRAHGLDALTLKFLGIQKIKTEELLGKGDKQISMAEVDHPKLTRYACEDADMTWRLHELFSPQLDHQELRRLYEEVEIPLVEILGDMERTGIAIDVGLLKSLSTRIEKRLKELTLEIHRHAGQDFNINSPKQLGPILFEKLRIQDLTGIKKVKKTKTGYSTDQDTLENYSSHPMVAVLLEFRNLSKLRSTYTDALPQLVHPKSGRIHTSFNQTVAATGRLSSSDPNLQNIPIRTELGREIRKAFIPGNKGWTLLSADYSQIELRILAHLSKDPEFLATFHRQEDVHRNTAANIFNVPPEKVSSELRNRAKAINFGVLYGMGPQRLARETGITFQEAKQFIEAYFEKFAHIKGYLDRQVLQAREKGYVTTLLGRKRPLPDILSTNPRIAANSERMAINTPIQGSAADLIKVAMVHIFQAFKDQKLKSKMLLQVHDELVFEVPPDEVKTVSKLVKEKMENAITFDVPVVVEVGVGPNWAEAH